MRPRENATTRTSLNACPSLSTVGPRSTVARMGGRDATPVTSVVPCLDVLVVAESIASLRCTVVNCAEARTDAAGVAAARM